MDTQKKPVEQHEQEIYVLEQAKAKAFEDWQKMNAVNADVANQLIQVIEGIDGLKDRFTQVNKTTQYLNQLAVLKELLISSAPADETDINNGQKFKVVIFKSDDRKHIVSLIMRIVEKLDAELDK